MRARNGGSMQWPEHIFGPRPGLKELNVLCWSLLIGCIVAPVSFSIWVQLRNGASFFSRPVDFVYFYGTGSIAAEHSIYDVYNFSLQLEEFNKILPLQDGSYGPSPYPPFVPLFFSQFARMSFNYAYTVWVCLSVLLYAAGLALALRDFFPGRALEQSLIVCFALSYYPFLFSTFFNGQLSCVGFIATVIALSKEERNQPFQSGLALAVLAYKPTLLLLLIPMLLVTRRFRIFMGFIAGTIGLICLSSLIAGPLVWTAYLRFLNSFAHVSGLYGQSSLRLWQFNDLNSFSCAVAGGRTPGGLLILAFVSVIAIVYLAVLLWRSANGDRPELRLAWATTLTWSMLLNVYYPIYDTILIAVSIMLSIAAARDLNCRRCVGGVTSLALLVFGTSWITESVAKAYGVQLLTLSILSLGIMQMFLLHLATDRRGKRTSEFLTASHLKV